MKKKQGRSQKTEGRFEPPPPRESAERFMPVHQEEQQALMLTSVVDFKTWRGSSIDSFESFSVEQNEAKMSRLPGDKKYTDRPCSSGLTERVRERPANLNGDKCGSSGFHKCYCYRMAPIMTVVQVISLQKTVSTI